jgi:hypothetical protein
VIDEVNGDAEDGPVIEVELSAPCPPGYVLAGRREGPMFEYPSPELL